MEGAGVESARTADTGDGQGQTQGRERGQVVTLT